MPRLCRCVASFSASVLRRRQDFSGSIGPARRAGAGGADQHQALRACAGVPDHIACDQPAHGENPADCKARLRPPMRLATPAAMRRRCRQRKSGAGGVADSPDPGRSGNQQHEISRQRLDVAHPVHPQLPVPPCSRTSGAPVPHTRHTTSPAPIGGGTARAGAIERRDEFRGVCCGNGHVMIHAAPRAPTRTYRFRRQVPGCFEDSGTGNLIGACGRLPRPRRNKSWHIQDVQHARAIPQYPARRFRPGRAEIAGSESSRRIPAQHLRGGLDDLNC